ncbi:hypothetical protein QR685DRAFT_448269 [Neurospora intermedia]|uniref:Secreted protein n=1 Tax=Neurospora intermedia TaxID=5142 RepID=A0ABR3D4I3_NEUIN
MATRWAFGLLLTWRCEAPLADFFVLKVCHMVAHKTGSSQSVSFLERDVGVSWISKGAEMSK